MGSFLNRRPAKYRYLVVFDSVDDDKIYGIMKVDTKGIRTSIEFHFFNDIGKIDLSIREVSRTEWETMKAFELFPILTPYWRDPEIHIHAHFYSSGKPVKDKHKITLFKVRFRDY